MPQALSLALVFPLGPGKSHRGTRGAGSGRKEQGAYGAYASAVTEGERRERLGRESYGSTWDHPWVPQVRLINSTCFTTPSPIIYHLQPKPGDCSMGRNASEPLFCSKTVHLVPGRVGVYAQALISALRVSQHGFLRLSKY